MLKELLNISGFPSLLQAPQQQFLTKAGTVLKTYGLIFLSLMAVGWLLYAADYFVVHIMHYKSIQGQYSETMEKMIKRVGYVKALVYICLIGPILEELVFRLSLSFKKIHLAISIAVAIFLFGNIIPAVKNLSLTIGLWYAVLIRLAFSALFCFVLIRLLPSGRSFSPLFKQTIIILSIVIFGLMHISNFIPLQWALLWIYPIYVLPQMLMGWGITYVRFKNGFIWGIAMHCLINSMSMLVFSNLKELKMKQTYPQHKTVRTSKQQMMFYKA